MQFPIHQLSLKPIMGSTCHNSIFLYTRKNDSSTPESLGTPILLGMKGKGFNPGCSEYFHCCLKNENRCVYPEHRGWNPRRSCVVQGEGRLSLPLGRRFTHFKLFYLNPWLVWKLLSQTGLCHPATLQRAWCGVWLWLKRGELFYRIICGQRGVPVIIYLYSALSSTESKAWEL